MPVDPRCPYDLSLDCFADAPEAERPTFTFRRLSCREFLEFQKVSELNGQMASEAAPVLIGALRTGLMGWRNQIDLETGQPIEFDPTKLEQLIDHVDAWELISKRIGRAQVNGEQLKNSDAPALSGQASSADTPKESATA